MSESTLPGRPAAQEETRRQFSLQQVLRRIGALLSARSMVPVWLPAIVLMAALFRFTGLNWDQGTHRHPDERHLTMVIERVQWPSSFGEYLNEQTSTLNPRNNEFAWFYGDLSITIVKGVTQVLNAVALSDPTETPWHSYGRGYLVGRAVSALFDLGTLLVLFLIARRLYNDHRIALLAAFLYSITVLPIQHSHFWVVDNIVTFFVAVTVYWLIRIFKSEGAGHIRVYALAGLFFGAALATKASVYTLAVVFGAVGLYKLVEEWRREGRFPQAFLEQLILRFGVAVLVTLVAFRIFQPYAFSGPNVYDFGLSPRWLGHMHEVQGQVTGEADPPWGFQWANRTPIVFPLKNMLLWGMGLPLGLAAWAGWGTAAAQMVRRNRWVHLVPVVWVITLFLHQGTQWVKSLRYFLPIYPMLVMLAAWLLVWLWDRTKPEEVGARVAGLFAWTRAKAGIVAALVVGGTLLYALAFTSIYTRPHTHVQAARWLVENIPSGSIVGFEHFDEGLPIYMIEFNPEWRTYQGLTYVTQEGEVKTDGSLNWYDEDNAVKLETALGWLDETEYIVTVSNRLYGSTARLPARFPMTVNYYQALFSGELGFERVADFTSGPQLFGIELDDQFSAEEAFSVYDHPRVQIFRKTADYDRETARDILMEGVDWTNISRLTAKQWTDTGGETHTLTFDAATWQTYQQSGTWSSLFNRASIQNRVPVLVWALLLEVLGLLALPYLMVAARSLPERGLGFAKPLGLLLVGWLVWLLASFRLVTFSAGGIFLAMVLVGLGGVALLWLAARSRGLSVPDFLREGWRAHRRLFLAAEAIFWAFFLLLLAVRWANPDLWHPDLGGEKPMDFAYLNAIVKSTYFPPMDPWFAGGYINYYYFGFVLVGLLVKFTGIVPAIAYNLALPTLFAMMAAGVWAAALALLVPLARTKDEGRRTEDGEGGEAAGASRLPFGKTTFGFALLAAVFVSVLGNLGELEVLANGLRNLSTSSFRSGIPGLELAVKSVDGLVRGMILHGQTLPGRMEWPYWNPTRVISHLPGEAGPITEMPWFTFLYADLHAHMMALPFTVLAIGLTLAFLRAPQRGRSRVAEGLHLFLLALALGVLWPTNTWDFPTYALVAFAGLGLREWREAGAITARGVVAVLWRWALVLGLGYLLFQPFHANNASAYTSVERWRGSRTGIIDYLTVHGLFLFAIFFGLVSDFVYGRGHNGAVRIARYNLRHLTRGARARELHARLVRPTPGTTSARYALALAMGVALFLLLIGWAVPALTLALLAFALALFFRERPQSLWQMVLFFVILGLGLTLAVELVVLKGDISRMNTVFKFYLQVWVLWGIAAVLSAALVARHLPRWLPEWRFVWQAGFVTLFCVALLYPIFATHAKINDRFDRSVGATLNGAAFMENAVIQEADRNTGAPVQIPLKWDAEAIRWMQENVPGSPVVAEMQTWDKLYGWGSRYAMWTGNPAIVGWHWHQQQQRAAAQPERIMERVTDVQQGIYNNPDAASAHETLLKYDSDYIVVGPLERAYATPEGIAKFEAGRGTYWDLVYENPEVQIYRVTE
ncbi:MAG TPA: DUF2298 domain-containing protein [Ardenticatenaceae bacterium]